MLLPDELLYEGTDVGRLVVLLLTVPDDDLEVAAAGLRWLDVGRVAAAEDLLAVAAAGLLTEVLD